MIFSGDRTARTLKDPSEISELLKDEHNFVWLDLAEPTEADLALLQEEFALHPTAIEDAALEHERPKIEAYEGFWLVVLHAATVEHGELVLHEIALFVGAELPGHDPRAPGLPARRDRAPLAGARRDPAHLDRTALRDPRCRRRRRTIPSRARTTSGSSRSRTKCSAPARTERGGDAARGLAFKRDLVHLRHAVAPVRDILAPMLRGEFGRRVRSVMTRTSATSTTTRCA